MTIEIGENLANAIITVAFLVAGVVGVVLILRNLL